MESNYNSNDAIKQKINIWRQIVGIILIGFVLLLWMVLSVILKWEALGGIIMLIPMFYLVKGIWNSFVLQKVKPKQVQKTKQKQSIQIDDNIENESYRVDESNDIRSTSIETNAIISNKPSTKPSWFKQGINFLTFDTPTFRSVFDEGQRRVVLVLSFIIPIISSYVLRKDWEEGYINYDDDYIVYCLISYLIYFVVLLIYIWIREGSGNVRPGGNAGKSLWNMVKLGAITFVIFTAVAISFKEYERVQEQKRIAEEKVVVLEKTERFVSCIPTENIDCITDFFVYHKKNEIRNGYLESFRDCDFKNASLKNASIQRKWNNQWNYELNGKIEYNIRCSKKGAFEQVLNNITVQYDTELKIIDIKITH